jgi:site-specific recombinase XerD
MPMLDQFVRKPDLLRRLRHGVLGDVLEQFVADLCARGHTAHSIREYVRGAGHFACWLELKRLPVATICEATVATFMQEHNGTCECDVARGNMRHVRASLRQLLATQRSRGLIAAPPAPATPSAVDGCITAFTAHSRECRGLRPDTLRQLALYAREFLHARFGAGPVDPRAITCQDVRTFVATRARRTPGRAAQCAAGSLRALLRFLVLRGECDAGLVGAVPSVTSHRVRLPERLTDEQVAVLLASFDRSTASGRRDYAIAMCLAMLGLRIGEVVGLRLDDVDWTGAILSIVPGKSRRTARLPLPSDVGKAIAEYVRNGRPATTERHIFVTHYAPRGRALSRNGAGTMIRRAFQRAGIDALGKGPHLLRHTVASRMVTNGASLKHVADVLRHRSLDSAFIYTRIDLPTLRAVAMPWPQVP